LFSHLAVLAASAALIVPAAGPPTHGLDAATSFRSDAPSADLYPPWCGEERTGDDTAHQVANGAARYHALLAVPADAPVRLRELAPGIQAGAIGASALIERQYGRAIRYDMGTSCGPKYLDISVLHMGADSETLGADAAGSADATLRRVYAELTAAGWPVAIPGADDQPRVDANYVVWLDGPTPAGSCGAATLYPDPRRDPENDNDRGGAVAVVFPGADGFCDADAVRHEIGHTLGAVQPGAGPSADATGHCTDAFEDTMCQDSSPVVADGHYQGEFVDYRNDDYWDPPGGAPLGWWTANLSRFLCPTATCNGVRATDAAPPAARPKRASAKRRCVTRRCRRARRARLRSRRRSAARRAHRAARRAKPARRPPG